MRNKKGQFVKGMTSWIKGRKHTDKSRKQMSKSLKGKPAWNKGKSAPWAKNLPQRFKKGHIPWNKGLKGYWSGDKNPNWRGGVTPEHERIRKSIEYKEWRKAVLKRDNWKCVMCGVAQTRKCPVVADHIKPFSLFPDLRFEISNGRTLCKFCDAKYGFRWNRHKSWEENFSEYQLKNSNK